MEFRHFIHCLIAAAGVGTEFFAWFTQDHIMGAAALVGTVASGASAYYWSWASKRRELQVRDENDRRTQESLNAIYAANNDAILSGKPVPFPNFLPNVPTFVVEVPTPVPLPVKSNG